MSDPIFENPIATALERNKLLRGSVVEDLTQVGKTRRNELIKLGKFPKQVKQIGKNGLPGRTNFWTQGDILDYLEARVADRNQRIAEVASEGLNGWLSQAVKKTGGANHE